MEERVWPAEYIPRIRLIGEIFMNALMREQMNRFEMLLSDISARFVNLPCEQIDREIEETQVRICGCLGIDRSAVCQISETGQWDMHLTHHHQAPGGPPIPEDPVPPNMFPWLVPRLMLGETVLVSSLDDLPAEAATDKESFRLIGTRSCAVFPLQAGGTFIGVISFASFRREMKWSEGLVRRLRLVAQIIANALARKRSDHDLRERRGDSQDRLPVGGG